MRDWNKEKRLYDGSFGYHPTGRELMEAIAEIEQLREWYQSQICLTELLGEENNLLRQDKAELVETMTQLAGAFEQLAKRPKVFISWKSYTIWHDANILVAKHGGGQSDE